MIDRPLTELLLRLPVVVDGFVFVCPVRLPVVELTHCPSGFVWDDCRFKAIEAVLRKRREGER